MSPTHKNRLDRRTVLKGAAASTVGILAAPMVARSEDKAIKVGMTTILSGRVAQLGTSSRNAVMLEVDKVNAAGGLAGRQVEMVIRDSKGAPQEAARVARELVNQSQPTAPIALRPISKRAAARDWLKKNWRIIRRDKHARHEIHPSRWQGIQPGRKGGLRSVWSYFENLADA